MDGAEQQQNEGAAPASAAGNGDHPIAAARLLWRWRGAWWALGIACLLGLAVTGAKWARMENANNESKENLHILEVSIHRFAIQYNRIPTSEELLAFVANPPSALQWIGEQHLRNPVTGDELELVDFSDRSPGKATYVAIPNSEYEPEWGDACGYYLLAYGYSASSGRDIDGDGAGDGVVFLLVSSALYGRNQQGTPYSINCVNSPPSQLDTAWKAIQWAEGHKE